MKFRLNSGTADVFISDGCYLYAKRRDDGIDLMAYPLSPVEGKYDMGFPIRNNGGYPTDVNEDFFRHLTPATNFADIRTIMRDRASMDAEDNIGTKSDYRFQSGTAEVFDDEAIGGFKCYLFAQTDSNEISVRRYLDKGDHDWEVEDHGGASQGYLNGFVKTTDVEKIKDILYMEAEDDIYANVVYVPKRV